MGVVLSNLFLFIVSTGIILWTLYLKLFIKIKGSRNIILKLNMQQDNLSLLILDIFSLLAICYLFFFEPQSIEGSKLSFILIVYFLIAGLFLGLIKIEFRNDGIVTHYGLVGWNKIKKYKIEGSYLIIDVDSNISKVRNYKIPENEMSNIRNLIGRNLTNNLSD